MGFTIQAGGLAIRTQNQQQFCTLITYPPATAGGTDLAQDKF